MIEAEIVEAFAVWLGREGWVVRRGVDYIDLIAERDGETLLAEAKGTTAAPGLDVDAGYGQLIRRMTSHPAAERYVLVVPTSARRAAERVGPEVRHLLKIDIYVVADNGAVELI